jgi:endonuclease/exonuclease/phosphatase family metal-dependent hydrolase
LDRCGGLVRVQEDPDLWSSCRPIFNGSADNVILSKFPITQSDFLKFTFAPIWATNVVYAKIQPPGWPSPLNVFCTHLAPEVPLFNFQETNLAQARQLLDFVRQKVPNQNETIVILGDFNSGPEIDRLDVDDTFPRTYELIRQNSFIDTLTLTSNRQATRDEERNRFADKTEMIDHIFVLQPNATVRFG